MTLATFYNRQGEFDKSMEALKARAEKEPNNPEAFYTIAQFYWEKAYRDFTISDADKMKFVMAGNEAIDKAIQLKADYPEASRQGAAAARAGELWRRTPSASRNW